MLATNVRNYITKDYFLFKISLNKSQPIYLSCIIIFYVKPKKYSTILVFVYKKSSITLICAHNTKDVYL